MEAPLQPIRIRPGKAGRIAVILPYTEDRVARIKTVSGYRWEPRERCWTVPRTARTVQRLLALFSGDQVEVDPALRSPKPEHPGQRPPLRVAPGFARDMLRAVENELKAKKYSPKTTKVYTLHIKRLLQQIKKPPGNITSKEVRTYLRELAGRKGVSRSYQNQAVSAIRFLYNHVFKEPDPTSETSPSEETG